MYFWLICIIYTGWWKKFIENNFKILVKLKKKKFGLDFLKITTYLEVQDRLIWLWNMNQLYVVKQKHWPDEHLCEQFFVLPNTSMLWLELWQLRVNLLYKQFPWKYFFNILFPFPVSRYFLRQNILTGFVSDIYPKVRGKNIP